MAGGNSPTNCSYAALKHCSSKIITCDAHMVSSFHKSMREKTWLMDSLLVISAILAGTIVGIGIYGQRYRHHRFTRFIFLGATTLFLPVVSTVVSMGAGDSDYSTPYMEEEDLIWLTAKCQPLGNSILVVIWASLVQIIMINTSAVVAVDDREGGNRGPPFELLVRGVWTFYLGISNIIVTTGGGFETENLIVTGLEVAPFALTCAKMVFKYYAFGKARQSFALGRNPQLIFGHMKQRSLQEKSHHGEPVVAEDAPPPPLVVMGEEKRHVEKQPIGYVFKDDSWTILHNSGLVTIDRVWKFDNVLPTSTLKQQKDLCLSFALFKLLRCRFARYKVRNAAFSFFWSLLLKDGEHGRVFLVISDELSFLHDYYYSSLPISYSKYWLPIVGIFMSLLTISFCCVLWIGSFWFPLNVGHRLVHQIRCQFFCIRDHKLVSGVGHTVYGSIYLDLVPVFLLSVLVMMSEVREIAAYICSNWTKVAVTCHLVNHASSQHSLLKKKWIGLLLRCRCKLMNHWDEKIGQCTVLEIRPRTTLPVLLRRLLRLPDHKKKVKLPAAVMVCIMEVVRSTRNDLISNGTASLRRRGQVGESLLWACHNESTSYTILTWHIATRIFEVRHPHRLHQEQGGSLSIPKTDYKIVATHLSRYCAYLVTSCPELLPDDDAWSRSLYEDVKDDAERVLAGCTAGDSLTPEATYQQLIQVLSADAKHEVLKEGARLGKQLVELMIEGGEVAAWKLLAEFWSEMMVYVAPSDNLKGHSEAIARGGELITLLWVLLFHAGIVSRPGEDDGVAPTSAGVV